MRTHVKLGSMFLWELYVFEINIFSLKDNLILFLENNYKKQDKCFIKIIH